MLPHTLLPLVYLLPNLLPIVTIHGRLVIAAGGHFGQLDFVEHQPPRSSYAKFNGRPALLSVQKERERQSGRNGQTLGDSTMPSKKISTSNERTNGHRIDDQSKKKNREEFLKKVQIVPTKDEHAQQVIEHWADQAFSSLFAAIAHKKLKEFARPIQEEFGDCSKLAKTVVAHAQCVSDLFSDKIDGRKYIEKAEQKSSRFDRYRMKKRTEFRRRINKQKKQRDEEEKKEEEGKMKMGREEEQLNNWTTTTSTTMKAVTKSPRLEKYREKKSSEHIRRHLEEKNWVKKFEWKKTMKGEEVDEEEDVTTNAGDEWVGGFRMMRDSPIHKNNGVHSQKKVPISTMESVSNFPPKLKEKLEMKMPILSVKKVPILPLKKMPLTPLVAAISTTKLRLSIVSTKKPAEHIQKLYAAHRRGRRQTGIVKKNYYALMDTHTEGRLSPIGQIAKQMMKNVLKAKGKQEKDVVPWQETVGRLQESAKRKKDIKRRLEDANNVQSMDQLTFQGLKKQGAVEEDLNEIATEPGKVRAFLAKKRLERGKKGVPMEKVVNLMRDAIKLAYSFAGANTTGMEDKTMRMVSPRFLSVTPEDEAELNETVNFVSPSLFSIHNEGKGLENLTSLPNLMKSVAGPMGFSYKDQQMWLDLIMEASGVDESANRIEQELNGTAPAGGNGTLKDVWHKMDREKYEKEIRTPDGTPLYFTKQNISDGFAESEVRKVDTFEWIQKNITKGQIHDMNDTGFTLLSKDQLKRLYGLGSPYQDLELFNRFSLLDKHGMVEQILQDIHTLATVKSLKITPSMTVGENAIGGRHRSKRQAIVLSPVTFTTFVSRFLLQRPLILSPIIFSPIVLSPVVLGPAILSPALFVPFVLSPRLLSPAILSPSVFLPLILRFCLLILLISTLIDLACLSIDYMVQPVQFKGQRFVCTFLASPLSHWPISANFGRALYNILSVSMIFAKCALIVQFVYRWLIICHNYEMSYGRYALALSAAAMVASGEAFFIYLGSFQAEGNQTDCQQFAQSQGLLNIMSIPNEFLSSPTGLLVEVVFMADSLLRYLAIILINLHIWLKARRNLIPQHKKSIEIGLNLLVQALLLLFFSLSPVVMIVVSMANANANNEATSGNMAPDWGFLLANLNWVSTLYPMCTILIIGQYRRWLWKVAKRPFNKSPVTMLNPAPSTQHGIVPSTSSQQQQNVTINTNRIMPHAN